MALSNIDFYRTAASFPGPEGGLTVKYGGLNPGQSPVYAGAGAAGVLRGQLALNQMRAYRFPGLLRPERNARATIPVPLPGTVTNDSTITLDDGVNSRVFQFVNDGTGLAGGDVLVDIQGLVTAAELADAFAAAILGDFPNIIMDALPRVAPDGSARLVLLQRVPAIPGWVALYNQGQTGQASPPIAASDPLEWPGLPASLLGGRPSENGVPYVTAFQAAAIRLLPLNEYYKFEGPPVI